MGVPLLGAPGISLDQFGQKKSRAKKTLNRSGKKHFECIQSETKNNLRMTCTPEV